MRSANRGWLFLGLSCLAVAAAIPAIGQDDPKSLLPPGFGDPVETPDKQTPPDRGAPADILPSGNAPSSNGSTSTAGPLSADGLPATDDEDVSEDDELPDDVLTLQDLPAGVRRSTAQVGVLGPEDGGMAATAFGNADGRYLSYLMRKTQAPIASRWASILLRRALLSRTDTPRGVSGADWVAERAWVLLRMGEADAARLLVQSVDVDQYTPKMFQVAMQISLANADPSGLCPMVEPASATSKDPAWSMARAMCAALSGESAQASALIDVARAKPSGRGIDGLLAEKVVGAGGNTRRAVEVQWDNVPLLTTWRFGLASATAVEIPDALLDKSNPRVMAWRARAPLVPIEKRTRDAEVAAALGVFSNAALVDFYGEVADETDSSAVSGTTADTLRTAYSAADPSARVDAMRTLWSVESSAPYGKYARLILTARAAGRLAPSDSFDDDLVSIIGSMMSAGLDVQAARWSNIVSEAGGDSGKQAWGLLAVGAPGRVVEWNRSRLESYIGSVGEDELRGRFLFAGMAGLGRLDPADVQSVAQSLSIPLTRTSAWTRALDRAVAAREPATVAVLCALGLSGGDWRKVSPEQLYHAIAALNAVGLVPEARMIAAEAISRV